MLIVSLEAIFDLGLEFIDGVLERASMVLRVIIKLLNLLSFVGWDSKLLLSEFLVLVVVIMVMTKWALDELSVRKTQKGSDCKLHLINI